MTAVKANMLATKTRMKIAKARITTAKMATLLLTKKISPISIKFCKIY